MDKRIAAWFFVALLIFSAIAGLALEEIARQQHPWLQTLGVASLTMGLSLLTGIFLLFRRESMQHHQAKQARHRSEETFHALFESTPDAIVLVDQHGRIVRLNAQAEKLFGYRRDELLGQPIEVLLPERVRERHVGLRDPYLAAPQLRPMGADLSLYGRRKDASEFLVDIMLSPVSGSRDRMVIAVVRDVTARRQTEIRLAQQAQDLKAQRQAALNVAQDAHAAQKLAEAARQAAIEAEAELEKSHTSLLENQQRLAEAQQIAHIGSWSWQIADDRIECSDELYRMYGRAPDTWMHTASGFLELVHPEERERVRDLILAAKASGDSFKYDHRIVRPDGEVRTIQTIGRVITAPGGNAVRMVGTGQDITERRQAQERLEELARFDPLTGLPNRRFFLESLHSTLEQAEASGWRVAVLFLDLDGFKGVNDTLGHAVGDELLQAVSPRLLQSLRTRDTIGRLGGDEFAVILTAPPDAEAAALVAAKLNHGLREPFMIRGREIRVSASIGITLYPDDAQDVDTLLRFADTAMYAAKHSGKNAYRYYTADLNLRAQRKLELETALHNALERREFFLEYQPKVDLRSGRWAGVEALMRWNHPEKGRMSPGEFIPVLEETGLIVAVGEWLVNTVCAQLGEWQRSGVFPLGVAINISAKQLLQRSDPAREVDAGQAVTGQCGTDQLCLCLQRAMQLHGVRPHLLELELTESVLVIHDGQVVSMLERLKSLGVRLSVDDFGTGYSSLAYLKRFPIDALKIDGSFVRDIGADPDDAAITEAIVKMAHSLGLETIAEWAETQQQVDFLRSLGCNQAQGYYFSRPLAADALVREYQATGGRHPGISSGSA